MSTDFIKIQGFHPALDGQYFECLYSCSFENGKKYHETAAFGLIEVDTDGHILNLGDFKRVGDAYIYRNYEVDIVVDWHDEGEFSIMARSASDPDFWYSIEFAHHDFFTVAVRASRCYLGVVHKWSFNLAGEITRVKRRDYRIAGRHLITISNWQSGYMVDSTKYENDVLVKHRRRENWVSTYCEVLERIRDEEVVLRVVSSGTIGNKSSHAAFEIFTPDGVAMPGYPAHVEVYAL